MEINNMNKPNAFLGIKTCAEARELAASLIPYGWSQLSLWSAAARQIRKQILNKKRG